jgi:hypothetical protein
MKPTPGPWIVVTRQSGLFETASVMVVNAKTNDVVAMCNNPSISFESSMTNAALIAVSNDMLEALIAVQETVMSAMDGDITATVEAAPIAAMIGDIFERLANEAGIR